ncbi:DoxX family protein [Vibrio quintilis]|nr:DoxX family protein [Vibrio quintilis]
MMKALIDKVEMGFDFPELGKLILRVSFSLMFLLHGIHKIFAGTAFIQGLFIKAGLPGFMAYGVYLGEVAAPLLIILGLYTRVASVFIIGTCLVVIGLLHTGDLFSLNKFGAWAAEDIGTYLFAAISIFFLGSGKYAVRPNL